MGEACLENLYDVLMDCEVCAIAAEQCGQQNQQQVAQRDESGTVGEHDFRACGARTVTSVRLARVRECGMGTSVARNDVANFKHMMS